MQDANAKGISAKAEVACGKGWVEIIRRVRNDEHDLVIVGTRNSPRRRAIFARQHGAKTAAKLSLPGLGRPTRPRYERFADHGCQRLAAGLGESPGTRRRDRSAGPGRGSRRPRHPSPAQPHLGHAHGRYFNGSLRRTRPNRGAGRHPASKLPAWQRRKSASRSISSMAPRESNWRSSATSSSIGSTCW